MATVNITGCSALGNSLSALMTAADIEPGATPSYELCKIIQAYHPLGMKLTDLPIAKAQSQKRVITVLKSPEARVVAQFEGTWESMKVDAHIRNLGRSARTYGISSIALIAPDVPPNEPVPYEKIEALAISFNMLDPLNTAGSLVLNQDPNAPDFQKVKGISIAGKAYHPSRAVVLMNEDPLYIEYTTSAFGFVGRSVFQRILFPLKSFVNSMITDDMVVRKAGLLIMAIKVAGSIVDNLMSLFTGQKRSLLQEAATNNVLSVGQDDRVESLDMAKLEAPFTAARRNILENIAAGAPMPAKLLNNETFAEGFGEGVEDAKDVAQFIADIRTWLAPAYGFFDPIVQRKAWTPAFFKTMQAEFPEEYGSMTFEEAFYQWKNSFSATWPNLLEEPDSEKIKIEEVVVKAVIALVEVLRTDLDPENKALLIAWACDNFNQKKLLFGSPLELDFDALSKWTPPVADKAEDPEAPFSSKDSIAELDAAVARLPDRSPGSRMRAVMALTDALGNLSPAEKALLDRERKRA